MRKELYEAKKQMLHEAQSSPKIKRLLIEEIIPKIKLLSRSKRW